MRVACVNNSTHARLLVPGLNVQKLAFTQRHVHGFAQPMDLNQ
ncbi:hypothetical protein BLL52_0476 [Rhodoferax antarcticus ANT.BR]|uniref:Uncharacterized protein n=1 Tax=Rhodoferax antarcticus ANT.BR TaxID=1111071 RepID=A0A1Q8YJF9_9BURK|nr:hypothetical protein BLL52_0476 [Rhodoferax antarcticus ANT.BR]